MEARRAKQDSDIHALRHGNCDKVSSPPLGQAVITVGPRFQVATLSGTSIIGSRLGATTLPRCGPALPLSNGEAWLSDTEHTLTGPVIRPGNLPSNHLSRFAMLGFGHS